MEPLSLAGIGVAAIITVTVIGCLRVIGYEYYNAVLWHNLKVQVHRLRIEQQRRLQKMLDDENGVDAIDEPAVG